MPINENCNLVIKDAYSYDIKSAYPTIMGNMNWDFKNVDLDNKAERNIAIGKSQIGNENLSSFLMKSADNLVDFYLKNNGIEPEEIIVTQRDGFIITKMLHNIDEFIEMKFRGLIDFIVISLDRTKYLAVSGFDIDVKGVPHKYDALDEIYEMFANLNFYDKKALFSQMQTIKETILNSQNKQLFMIPKEDKFVVETKTLGAIEVSGEAIFSIDDVLKEKYYTFFIKDFLDSIFLEFY